MHISDGVVESIDSGVYKASAPISIHLLGYEGADGNSPLSSAVGAYPLVCREM